MHAQTQMPNMSICKKKKTHLPPFFAPQAHFWIQMQEQVQLKHVIFIAVAAGARGFSTRGPLLKHTAEYSPS